MQMQVHLAQRFGPEWDALTDAQRALVLADFASMLLEEYDMPDPTMGDFIAQENAHNASREYRRRIGGGNLQAYAETLAAGQARKQR